MLSFDDAAAIAAAPTTASIDSNLRRLITERVDDWKKTDLLDFTHLAIVQAGDSEEAVVEEVAFSPLTNPIDGKRFGSKGFRPCWDWLEHHNGWWEMIMHVGNDGFAFVLFIEDSDDIDPQLRRLCKTYSSATRQ